VAEGDLINALDFRAQYSSEKATMGETLPVELKKGMGNLVKITIKFKMPMQNNHGNAVAVDHIDLIAGNVTGRVAPGSANYNVATNASAKVIATFTADDWEYDRKGWYVIRYHTRVDHHMYFRLRGTNNAMSSLQIDQTSLNGDPALDAQGNTADEAWNDLWFYSNPIFVRVRR